MDKVPKKKIVSVYFNRALFCPLEKPLKTAPTGCPGTSGTELPLYAAYYLKRPHILHGDLAMQALVWICKVQFLSDLVCNFTHKLEMISRT